jgi:23S rRNA (uracil1939-C5)-methyltransferase
MKGRRTTDRVPPVSKLRQGINAAPAAPKLVTIEKPLYGGNFLAREEGKAIFVPFVLPGEQAQVHIVDDKAKRGYAVAELNEVIEPSPKRIDPRCPHFGPCGGCQYQHTDYVTQLELKQAVLRETLVRAGVPAPSEIHVLAAEPWAYRNRIRLAFDAAGRVGYRGRRSHEVIAIRECPISAGLLVRAALAMAEAMRNAHVRPSELALFCDGAESALLVTVNVASPVRMDLNALAASLTEHIPELRGIEVVQQQREQMPKLLQHWGETALHYGAAGPDYRVDHGAFFQVNRWLVDRLVDSVVGSAGGELAWDLFAGVGLFARPLADRFAMVIAVESAPAAVKALAANLEGTSGRAVSAPTLDFLRRHSGERPDLVVVDPPRTGLGPEIATLLAKIAAPELVYVSCDPATLARDLRALLALGYAIESVTMTDLFPQTFHLETVVRLRKS